MVNKIIRCEDFINDDYSYLSNMYKFSNFTDMFTDRDNYKYFCNIANKNLKQIIEVLTDEYSNMNKVDILDTYSGTLSMNEILEIKPDYVEFMVTGDYLMVCPLYYSDKELVYLIKIDGFYKIGISKNLTNRLNSYKTHIPFKFEVMAVFEPWWCTYKKLESLLHKVYKNNRRSGEWFDCHMSRKEFMEVCCLIDLNFNPQILQKDQESLVEFIQSKIKSDSLFE